MTREEREDAIDIIQSILDKYEEDECLVTEITIGDEDIKAFKMAIKALEQEPCEDAISRQEVKNKYRESLIHNLTDNDRGIDLSKYAEEPYKAFCKFIDSMPPVTPQPKTGHWIAQDIYNCHTEFKCSECGYIHSFMHLYGKPTADYTYCPNCGAKMVEPQEGEG